MISGPEVITRLGGAAVVVVTLAAEAEVGAAGVEVAAVSSVLRAHSKITSILMPMQALPKLEICLIFLKWPRLTSRALQLPKLVIFS